MKKIKEMNYSEFVGLINERNRPSGGIKTIQEVIVNARLDEKKKILEIGSNTGFTTNQAYTLCWIWGTSNLNRKILEGFLI